MMRSSAAPLSEMLSSKADNALLIVVAPAARFLRALTEHD